MILTVTLNAALDITYRVPALVPGTTHRVSGVTERAGGKGLNVARVLHALAEPVVATGLAGGASGARIRELLAADGVRDAFTPIAAESRRTVVVSAVGTEIRAPGPAASAGIAVTGVREPGAAVGTGITVREPDPAAGATGFWEPGPVVSAAEWAAFVARYGGLLRVARVVVLSGSLPPGVPDDAYARLIAAARHAGVRTVLDAAGTALRHGLDARPDLVKPNADELADLGAAPQELGAREVVTSYGAAGLVASTVDGQWRARLETPLAGNATGAGDACVAALARGMAHRFPWTERLVDAVALSAAAVTAPTAGSIDLPDWRRLRPTVMIEEV